MKTIEKGILSAVRHQEQAARSIFEFPKGHIEDWKVFFAAAKSTIHLSNLAHSNLDAWKNSVLLGKKKLEFEHVADWKDLMSALVSLTTLLLERAEPSHPEGGFALRPSPRRMLIICRERAQKTLNTWQDPVAAVPADVVEFMESLTHGRSAEDLAHLDRLAEKAVESKPGSEKEVEEWAERLVSDLVEHED